MKRRNHIWEAEKGVEVVRVAKDFVPILTCAMCNAVNKRTEHQRMLPSSDFYRISLSNPHTGVQFADFILCVDCMQTFRDKMTDKLRKL